MNQLIIRYFILSICLSTFVNGLFFQMGETEKKCFIQDVAENTKVTGNTNILRFVTFYIL